MRILLLNHNPQHFGTYYRCWFLAQEIAAYGHDVTLICASGREFTLSIRSKRERPHLTVLTLPRVKYHKYFTGQLVRLLITCAHLLRHTYDILHAFTVAQPQIGVPAYVYHRTGRGRLLVDWDDLWSGEGFGRYHPWPVRWVLQTFERRIPRLADRVTVVSRFLERQALAAGVAPERIVWLPNGVNMAALRSQDRREARAALNLEVEANLVVAVGNTYTRGLQLLLDGFERLRGRLPGAQLLLVGAVTIPKHDLERFGASLRVVGSRPYEEALQYLAAADVLALPMARDPIEEARFPIRLGDYLAAGRPIVSNAVGEVKRVLAEHECGLATDPDSAGGLADAMLMVLQDPLLAAEYGKRAHEAARELAWPKIGAQLEATYRRVLGEEAA